jgi:hypothetical protein
MPLRREFVQSLKILFDTDLHGSYELRSAVDEKSPLRLNPPMSDVDSQVLRPSKRLQKLA